MLLTGTSALTTAGLAAAGQVSQAQAQPAPPPRPATGHKQNILVIFGDDIGLWNVSAYNRGMMRYRTPNIDRIAREGAISNITRSNPARPGALRSLPASAAFAPGF
jgi:arylsulfatase